MLPSTWPGPAAEFRAGGSPSALEASCIPRPHMFATNLQYDVMRVSSNSQPAAHLLSAPFRFMRALHASRLDRERCGRELDKHWLKRININKTGWQQRARRLRGREQSCYGWDNRMGKRRIETKGRQHLHFDKGSVCIWSKRPLPFSGRGPCMNIYYGDFVATVSINKLFFIYLVPWNVINLINIIYDLDQLLLVSKNHKTIKSTAKLLLLQ